MIAVQGTLTMVGLNTPTPQIFWDGKELLGILSIRVDCDDDEQRTKIKVTDYADDALVAEMQAAGITIKRSIP